MFVQYYEMESSKEKQKYVVRFLVVEGAGTCEIHHRMSTVYGEHCMPLTGVRKRHKIFREKRISLQDDPRTGQAHRVITSDVNTQIDGLIRENQRISEEEIRVKSEMTMAP